MSHQKYIYTWNKQKITKIKDLLAELASKVGATVQIKDFIRFEVGESAAEQADKAAS